MCPHFFVPINLQNNIENSATLTLTRDNLENVKLMLLALFSN